MGKSLLKHTFPAISDSSTLIYNECCVVTQLRNKNIKPCPLIQLKIAFGHYNNDMQCR